MAAEAFQGRKWTVKSVSEDRVVGHLDHRGIDATLEFRILDDRIVYSCDCVKEKKYGKTSRNNRLVDWTPLGWINNLRRDIQRVLWGNATAALATEGARPVNRHNQLSIAERLQVLKDLLSQGLVSQEEYDTKREQILSDL